MSSNLLRRTRWAVIHMLFGDAAGAKWESRSGRSQRGSARGAAAGPEEEEEDGGRGKLYDDMHTPSQ